MDQPWLEPLCVAFRTHRALPNASGGSSRPFLALAGQGPQKIQKSCPSQIDPRQILITQALETIPGDWTLTVQKSIVNIYVAKKGGLGISHVEDRESIQKFWWTSCS